MCGREFNSLTNLSPVSKIPRRGEERSTVDPYFGWGVLCKC